MKKSRSDALCFLKITQLWNIFTPLSLKCLRTKANDTLSPSNWSKICYTSKPVDNMYIKHIQCWPKMSVKPGNLMYSIH